MLFVSINFSLEKIFVRLPAFVNLSCCVIFELKKFACVGLKCDTGQEPMTWSLHLHCVVVIAFSQTDLFLD